MCISVARDMFFHTTHTIMAAMLVFKITIVHYLFTCNHAVMYKVIELGSNWQRLGMYLRVLVYCRWNGIRWIIKMVDGQNLIHFSAPNVTRSTGHTHIWVSMNPILL